MRKFKISPKSARNSLIFWTPFDDDNRLTICDFLIIKDFAQSMETLEFELIES